MLVGQVGVELAARSSLLSADNMTDKAAALACLVNCPAAVQDAEPHLATV